MNPCHIPRSPPRDSVVLWSQISIVLVGEKKNQVLPENTQNDTLKNYIFSSALFCELNKKKMQLTTVLKEQLYLSLIFLDKAVSGHPGENIH